MTHASWRTRLRKRHFSLATSSPRQSLFHRTYSSIRAFLCHTYLISWSHKLRETNCFSLQAILRNISCLYFKLRYVCAGMNLCRKTPHLPVILNQAAIVHRHAFGLRKGSDNTNVCNLAHRSHVHARRVRIVPENTVNCPGLLETEHFSYVAVTLGWRNGLIM